MTRVQPPALAPPPRRRISLVAAAFVVALAAGGCAAPEATNEVVIALQAAPIHLDPRVATDRGSSRVFEAALNGLVTKDPNGNLVPDLATSWEVLDEGLRYRFHLRPEVLFHDGEPFTSADVVWTFGSMIDEVLVTPKRGAIPRIIGVEAVDPLTVDFLLDEPFGPLLADFTSYLGIVRDGSTDEENNRRLIGTGPFRVVERAPDRVELAAFDKYWEGRPEIDRLVFRGIPDATVRVLELRKGSAHLAVNDLPPDAVADFRDEPSYRVVIDPGTNYAYLGINFEDPLLSRLEVRRAIAAAIDRQRIVDTLWPGLAVVTETMMRTGHWSHNADLPRIVYDPEEAARLLDDAGLPDPDGDGPEPRFTITYKTSTDETYLLQAQVIQAMLAEVGIGVEIRSHEFATFYNDIKQGNFQLFSMVWTGIVDPNMLNLTLHSERIPPAGANRGRYRNPQFDRLLDLGARLTDPEKRLPYYLEAQEIFARELPYISLYLKSNVAVMPATLTGYRNYPSGELYSLDKLAWRRPGP